MGGGGERWGQFFCPFACCVGWIGWTEVPCGSGSALTVPHLLGCQETSRGVGITKVKRHYVQGKVRLANHN